MQHACEDACIGTAGRSERFIIGRWPSRSTCACARLCAVSESLGGFLV